MDESEITSWASQSPQHQVCVDNITGALQFGELLAVTRINSTNAGPLNSTFATFKGGPSEERFQDGDLVIVDLSNQRIIKAKHDGSTWGTFGTEASIP